ncbi:F-BAR domain only protein 2 isoform X2 [Oncorhynchus mykiss]|uniref:F-BAR domain only protein 2 isoform X2 n=1 Tax=Oncorhynchus mykiss TaxID=8022 RepID=UPI001877F1D3|nr:F-BAR domain only protein 2 isoform X2 [Oncorhynchus mykiss]
MITPYFLQNFWGEKNNGFDVLYHNMKHGQISSKELTEFIRERATIEEVYARSMTKLAKSAGNFSQLGTFAPVWDVFKTSTEKLASCHLELVRKLQELIKDVQKYVDDQAKAHKKTKEEVASTLESVQTIQTTGVALQKSKENYNAKTVEQERLRKEGATQRDVDKAGVKAKKATETYKGFVEKYATAKSEFEQKMAETAQKFQDIEESHIVHMKDIIQSYTQSVDETHVQIGEVRIEFERNMENTSVEGLIQKLSDSKGTGKERPGPIEFEECNTAIATEGAKPRKRKTFAIRRKDNKDTDSTESTEVEPANNTNGVPPGYYGTIDFQNANVPTVDEDGFCIRPEDRNQNDAKENSFYSSSDSEDEDEPRKFRVEIKPVAPNNRTQQSRATIDQLKASIGNISLSPPTSGQMRRNQSRLSGMHSHSAIGSQVLGDELGKARMSTYFNDRPALNNDLLSLDPFCPAPTLRGSSSSVSSSTDIDSLFLSIPLCPLHINESPVFLPGEAGSSLCPALDYHVPSTDEGVLQQEFSSPPLADGLQQAKGEVAPLPSSTTTTTTTTFSPWNSPADPFLALKPIPARAQRTPITRQDEPIEPTPGPDPTSVPQGENQSAFTRSQSQWIDVNHDFVPVRRQQSCCPGTGPVNRDRTQSNPPTGRPQSCRSICFFSDDPADPYNKMVLSSGVVEVSTSSVPEVFSALTVGVAAAASQAHNVPALARPTTPQTGAMVAPPRPSSRPKLPTGKLTGINEIVQPFSPTKMLSNASPPPAAPLARAESSSSLSSTASLSASNTPTVGPERIFRPSLSSPEPEFLLSPCPLFLLSQKDDGFIGKLPTFEKCCETPAGTSRGPSPVTLASQDALPIAVAFTESVNAYFKGADPAKCIVKITGDMTLSFPMGIIKVFTSNPSPAMLTFKLKNTSKLEQILPNQTLLFSDPSQSDAHTKDFWFNMQALTSYLKKASEQNPAASYYNVDILKYQVSSKGIASTPLNLAVYWKCDPATTDLRLDYHYNPESMLCPGTLSNVQVLVHVDGGVTNMQSLPNAIWNSELNKFLWKLNDISEKSDNEGSGSLRAKFELSDGPSTPTTLAVQFMSEGSTLSGVDIELLGTGYRLSLNKKRFATGRYMADC